MDIIAILTTIGTLVNTVFIPVLLIRTRKRKEEAEADNAEANTIKSYATEWKELYEKKEAKVEQLNAKIDSLYVKIEEDRTRIRGLMEKNQELALRNQLLEEQKCEIRGCDKRKPPSNTY